MQLHYLRHPSAPPPNILRGAVVAIGTFDGLHQGHQRLFETARATAQRLKAPCAVFTFVEHPRSVLQPGVTVQLLTPWPEKRDRFAKLGLDACFAAHFTPALSELTPQHFVDRVLVQELQVAAIVTGFNFRFGHRQAGTPELLQQLGIEKGMPVEVVAPVQDENGIISSSRIRELVQAGRVNEVAPLLGYAYTLSGEVVHGDKQGRTIGFPTANLAIADDKLLPAYGVYACTARFQGQSYPAVANIGMRPTVAGNNLRVEVHLLEGGGDLYGQIGEIALVQHLRGEQRFSSLEALKAQITQDCLAARELLTSIPV
jgi:riboflavin kinase / FMN adenylyltransferase